MGRKNIFEKLEQQQKKLQELERKKKQEIDNTILKSFSFLKKEEIFLVFYKKLNDNPEWIESLETLIMEKLGLEQPKNEI